MTTLREMLGRLPPERREAIAKRTDELIAEELTLRDVRKALNFTQEQIARALNVKQANVSQMEMRADLLLSTLSSYIEAMGGTLELTARFENRPAIKLQGFAALSEQPHALTANRSPTGRAKRVGKKQTTGQEKNLARA